MKRNLLVSLFTVFMAFSFSAPCFAQENQTSRQPEAVRENAVAASGVPVSAPMAKPVPTEWLYGEVNSVDVSGNTLTLTYLDYDTDIEKQATVSVDPKTIFENVKSLEEIKPQDMVSIDYVLGADNKNLAVSVSVEKPETIEDLNAEGAVPAEPKQQMKPAVEDTAVPAAADPGSEPAKGQ